MLDLNIYTNSISCWHQNSTESDAMWALYAQRQAGVAIRTTVRSILKAFESTDRVMHVARVIYDLDNTLSAMTSGICDSILIKRHAFQHEREIRIIASTFDGYESPEWSKDNQTYRIEPNKLVPPGAYIDCDLSSLIDELVISPLIPPHTYQAIETICETHLPDTPIRKSTLLTQDEPIPLTGKLGVMWNNYLATRRLLDFDEILSDNTPK